MRTKYYMEQILKGVFIGSLPALLMVCIYKQFDLSPNLTNQMMLGVYVGMAAGLSCFVWNRFIKNRSRSSYRKK